MGHWALWLLKEWSSVANFAITPRKFHSILPLLKLLCSYPGSGSGSISSLLCTMSGRAEGWGLRVSTHSDSCEKLGVSGSRSAPRIGDRMLSFICIYCLFLRPQFLVGPASVCPCCHSGQSYIYTSDNCHCLNWKLKGSMLFLVFRSPI